jgi:dTDP-glucose 4,6-dehydratase
LGDDIETRIRRPGAATGSHAQPDDGTEDIGLEDNAVNTVRRAVVAGGAGFIGSHLCARLRDSGTQVVCVDDFSTGAAENLAGLLEDPQFTLERRDVCEPFDIPGPVDLVVNLASPASPRDYALHPVETLKAGSQGTLHTLELALSKGARYVLASTSEVYGDPLVHPQVESYWGNVNPVGPRSQYDEAKRYAEALTTAYRTARGADTVIVRIFNTYGPRMRPNDGRAVPNFVTQALAGRPLTVAGDGSQTRSLCYVDDMVTAILAAARSGHPGPINLGNPAELTILDLAMRVRELCSSDSPIVFVDRPVDDPGLRMPDISLAQSVLGWRPSVDLEEGLKATIDWFSSHSATQ